MTLSRIQGMNSSSSCVFKKQTFSISTSSILFEEVFPIWALTLPELSGPRDHSRLESEPMVDQFEIQSSYFDRDHQFQRRRTTEPVHLILLHYHHHHHHRQPRSRRVSQMAMEEGKNPSPLNPWGPPGLSVKYMD